MDYPDPSGQNNATLGGTMPGLLTLQNPTQVIQPDNPPLRRGSWDDILAATDEPRASFAGVESFGDGNPADNQPLPAKLHDLSGGLRATPDKGNTDVANLPPVKGQAFRGSGEPRGMFDALDEPERPQPRISEPSVGTGAVTEKTEGLALRSVILCYKVDDKVQSFRFT